MEIAYALPTRFVLIFGERSEFQTLSGVSVTDRSVAIILDRTTSSYITPNTPFLTNVSIEHIVPLQDTRLFPALKFQLPGKSYVVVYDGQGNQFTVSSVVTLEGLPPLPRKLTKKTSRWVRSTLKTIEPFRLPPRTFEPLNNTLRAYNHRLKIRKERKV